MNKTQHMADILTAKQNGRKIECRRAGEMTNPDAWKPLDKRDMWLDFNTYEYRLAPVAAECWLVFDSVTAQYFGPPDAQFDKPVGFVSASDCADCAIQWNEVNNAAMRFVPIKLIPAHAA